jgi:putative ABC transport system substrate-binding protein
MNPRFDRRQAIRALAGAGLSSAGLALLVGCAVLPSRAQSAAGEAKVHQIGFLFPASVASTQSPSDSRFAPFHQQMQALGYRVPAGIRLMIDLPAGGRGQVSERAPEVQYQAMPADGRPGFAAELAGRKLDVIIAFGTPTIQAAKEATDTVPIVMLETGDPVAAGLVASLARPGGNVTGLSDLSPELSAKRLEILKQIAPAVYRVSLLWNAANPDKASELRGVQAGAQALGLTVQSLEVRTIYEFSDAFQAAARDNSGALITLGDSLTDGNEVLILDFARRRRLPTVFDDRRPVERGGLMSYGPSYADSLRRAAVYVDRILRGAQPADLPVEQPTTFDLVVNLKTAQGLGLAIPASVFAQATEVIQ